MSSSERCIILVVISLFPMLIVYTSGGQDVSMESKLASVSLPKEALRSRYRIRILEATPGQLETAQKLAKEFTARYRLNSYISIKDNTLFLDAGDFTEKRYARQRMDLLKKNYPKVKVVKSENVAVSEFIVYERMRPEQKKTAVNLSENHPANKMEIRTIEVRSNVVPAERSAKWGDPMYLEANSAVNEDYLTEDEKKIFYYLNLVRMNPKLFADTYLGHLRNSGDKYESSLYSELQKIDPLPVLKPNRKLYESAKCHAEESGERGYLGHNRKKCPEYFMGECCQYGISNPLNIIISLLIDQGIPDLGHRKVCLSPYTELGVSIRPHKTYRVNTVMDFY